jgi:D-serine deaminase-like pyridoxal phosphate-dependent protein
MAMDESLQIPTGVTTPATVVLSDRLEHNLAAMARTAAAAGASLRPHAKTHKCRELAARQLGHGARGLSVATVGEAEILSDPGHGLEPTADDVFIAYPLWPADDLVGRLRDLTNQAVVRVGVDSSAAIEQLAPLAGSLGVMIEVDCGLSRSGVRPEGVAEIAQTAMRAGLDVAGVFTFPGHSYAPGAASAAARDEARALAEADTSLASVGLRDLERSGGSTPTASLAEPGTLTELRPGVYVFNDAQQVELGTVSREHVALVVVATVVSRPEPGRVVLDSGSKVLGSDRPSWTSGHGLLVGWPEARVTGLWEHHAVVTLNGGSGPGLGEKVAVIPNHVCTAVNLVPELLIASDGEIVDRWSVAARAANR